MECPICKLKYSPRDIQGHVNQCLDRKETKKQVKEDEKLAQQLHRQLSVSSTTPDQNNYPQQQRSSPSQVNPQAYASPNTSPVHFIVFGPDFLSKCSILQYIHNNKCTLNQTTSILQHQCPILTNLTQFNTMATDR